MNPAPLPSTPATASCCAHCGAAFTCGAVAGTAHCWCVELPRLQRILPDISSCLCPDCLARALEKEQHANLSPAPGRQP